MVVDSPRTSQTASTSLGSCRKRKQRDDIAGVSVEDLFVSRVRRRTNFDFLRIAICSKPGSDVFDVSHNHVRSLAVQVGVLSATDGTNVGRNTRVDDDVLLARVTINVQAANDEEAVAGMELLRQTA